MDDTVMPLTCNLIVQFPILIMTVVTLTVIFYCFPHSLQADVGTGSQIKL
jgi:hypothetical protein